MIQITLKEAKQLNYKDVIIKLTEDGIKYYRKPVQLFVVRWWIDDNTSFEREFKTLKQAIKYGLSKLDTFDINYYKDKNNRYWTKQYQFVKGELNDEVENDSESNM